MFMSTPSDQLVFLQLRVLICDRISIEHVALVCLLRNCQGLKHLAARGLHGSYINLSYYLEFECKQITKRITA